MDKSGLLYEVETFAIRGAVFEVSKEMGIGFLESIYQECLAREFRAQSIPAVAHMELQLAYKGEVLSQTFKPDFVCFNKIVVELKAAKAFTDEHRAQLLNYLKATGYRVGLLVNFGCHPKALIERIAL